MTANGRELPNEKFLIEMSEQVDETELPLGWIFLAWSFLPEWKRDELGHRATWIAALLPPDVDDVAYAQELANRAIWPFPN